MAASRKGEHQMDPSRFDDLTKTLATSTSRRQALKTIAATTLGGILGLSGIGTAFAKCKPATHKCNHDHQCCSGMVCPSGQCCVPSGGTFPYETCGPSLCCTSTVCCSNG